METDFNTFLAIAFGCWAGVVGWIGRGIRQDLKGIRQDIKEESAKLNEYILDTESRLIRLEQRCDNYDKI